jgi:NTE family protein
MAETPTNPGSASALGVKRALVLGCGGVAGAAWTVATLAELERSLGWDARTADVLIGTSAGALVAALLGTGISVKRMVESQRGELADDCFDHASDWGPAQPPTPGLRLTAPRLALGALRGRLDPMTGLSGLLPQGRADFTPLRRLIERCAGGARWTSHPATWIMVVDAHSGARVALGRAGSPRVPLASAVCASYAIPGWYPPLRHDGATYLDGGVASPTSADMLLGSDVREAIVLAPMASRELDGPRPQRSMAERLRRHMTSIVNREVRALEQAGIRVARLEPCAEDLAAFGANLMNPRRRKRVFDTAVESAKHAVADALLALEG